MDVADVDERAADGVFLQLLGGFGLFVHGEAVDVPAPAQRTLALAALRRLTRAQAARLLAPDADESLAMGRLRTRLWRLRQLSPHLLAENVHLLQLGAQVRLDVTRLLDWAADVGRGVVPDEVPFTGLGEWDLLPDHDDDWLLVDRERLREVRLHALEDVARLLARAGRYGLALQAALASTGEDPLRESGQRAVIGVYLAEGNIEQALSRYLAFERRLRDELGVGPSPRLADLLAEHGLQAALRRSRPLLPASRAP